MQQAEWPPSQHFLPIQNAHTLPYFTIANITNYFIVRITSDGNSANDFKSLNSKAFPLFKDGHVQSIQVRTNVDKTYYQANCLPEMKKVTIYTIRLIINASNSDISYAQCGCPAGCGPKGSCKHIAAMCYALEDFSRIKHLRDPVSCTSQLQTWNQPRKRHLEPVDVHRIKFLKQEYGKEKRVYNVSQYDPRPVSLRQTTEEVQALHIKLSQKSSTRFVCQQFQSITTSPPIIS